MRKISGDAFYVYISPASTSYPWVRIWKRPCGVRGKNGEDAASELGDYWHYSLDELAQAIGKCIVKHSPILQEWGDRD